MKHILFTCLLSMVGCSQCTPTIPEPTPPDPTEPTQAEKCAQACERWRDAGCKDSEDVCTGFDDAGECTQTITCEQSCVEDPDAYDTDAGCS